MVAPFLIERPNPSAHPKRVLEGVRGAKPTEARLWTPRVLWVFPHLRPLPKNIRKTEGSKSWLRAFVVVDR